MQNFSFFEVPERDAQKVIKSMSRQEQNGRRLSVEVAQAGTVLPIEIGGEGGNAIATVEVFAIGVPPVGIQIPDLRIRVHQIRKVTEKVVNQNIDK